MSTQQTIPAFIEQVIHNIDLGMIDVHLPHLINIINNRQRIIAPKVNSNGISIRDAREGDIVVFNSKVRPTYLRGAKATIVKVNRERVKVKLMIPQGRFGDKTISTPVTILNFVS